MKEKKRYNTVVAVKRERNTQQLKFVLQYRGIIFKEFVKKLNKIHPGQTIFTTRKLKSSLPSLKSSFDKEIKPHVIYELTCNECKSIYVGQTCQHITTWAAEHAKTDSPMGRQSIECNGDKNSFPVENIRPVRQPKLMTLEALYKRTLKPDARRIQNAKIDTDSLVLGDETPTRKKNTL